MQNKTKSMDYILRTLRSTNNPNEAGTENIKNFVSLYKNPKTEVHWFIVLISRRIKLRHYRRGNP